MGDITSIKVKQVRDQIHVRSNRKIGMTVAKELLMLAGGDVDLAVDCSVHSDGLDQCKATILNERFRLIEEYIFDNI